MVFVWTEQTRFIYGWPPSLTPIIWLPLFTFTALQVNTFRVGTTSPVLGSKFWPKSKTTRLTTLKEYIFQLSMDLVLEPFWDLNYNGFAHDISLNGSIQRKIVVPYVVTGCVDLEEAWAMSCRPKNGNYCHLKLHISKNDYINPNVRFCLNNVYVYIVFKPSLNLIQYMFKVSLNPSFLLYLNIVYTWFKPPLLPI